MLGVGVGWARQEFEALGVPFQRRGKLTDELITTVREAWQDEGYRAGHIPIWVGGQSDGGAAARGPARRRLAPAAADPAGWQESLARLKKSPSRRNARGPRWRRASC